MSDQLAVLADRAVLAVTGGEARSFLQRLVTNDVAAIGPGEARYAALLTPQGKIVTDFFVIGRRDDEGVWLDVPAANAADLVKKLTLYRLRAKIGIEDRSEALAIVAFSGEAPKAGVELAYADPRDPSLWHRAIVERTALPTGDIAAARAAYALRRIAAGVPEGGLDFAYGDTFPHEANLDHLHGVDFRKGCYVGQEVVSRVEHRGTARKRIVTAAFDGEAPPVGAEILAGDVVIGTMGSSVGGRGLAMVRLDRAEDGAAALQAAGVPLRLSRPGWA